MNYIELHKENKENSLFGRYITLKDIEPLLIKFNPEIVGYSVLKKPIYRLDIGSGKTKVFMWSQMHGNESTTTKAVFDLLNVLESKSEFADTLLNNFTFCILPMVNPDGAELYSRENANEIDLNRDAKDLSQPESIALRNTFDDFQPDICYNLHDQRTIYGVEGKQKTATVSFLAPSFNAEREISPTRAKAMNIIVAMNDELQKHIPDQVGRYEDEFNGNCVGDTFQSKNIPTVLFESGHFPNDYYREVTRKMIFIALISGLKHIYENDIVDNEIDNYMLIPQNKVHFVDFFYKNVKINYENKNIITNIAIQYKEELVEGKIDFVAYISEVGELKDLVGHFEFNAHKMMFSSEFSSYPEVDSKANFKLGDSIEVKNGEKL